MQGYPDSQIARALEKSGNDLEEATRWLQVPTCSRVVTQSLTRQAVFRRMRAGSTSRWRLLAATGTHSAADEPRARSQIMDALQQDSKPGAGAFFSHMLHWVLY